MNKIVGQSPLSQQSHGTNTSKDCLVLADSTNTAKIRLYVSLQQPWILSST